MKTTFCVQEYQSRTMLVEVLTKEGYTVSTEKKLDAFGRIVGWIIRFTDEPVLDKVEDCV